MLIEGVVQWHSPGNFCWPTGKVVSKKKGKMEKKRRKIVKGRWEIKNERGGRSMKMSRGLFFFFALHFLKPLKFVWGVPKWKISTGKKHISCREKHISRREKIGKSDFAPPPKKNIPLTPLVWCKMYCDIDLHLWLLPSVFPLRIISLGQFDKI